MLCIDMITVNGWCVGSKGGGGGFADRFPSTEMGVRGLAKLLALLRPAVDSGSKSLRVDVGRWAGVGIWPIEDFAYRLAEAFEVC